METNKRSIAKAFSWRFLATLITCTIVWIITGRFEFAATIGLLDTSIKIFIYFLHERIWLKVPFGRLRAPEYEI